MKDFDFVRFGVILIAVFVLFQAMPVHFFADNAENLSLAKHYQKNPGEIFSLWPNQNIQNLHPAVRYRPFQRIFWTAGYAISGLNPVSYNVIQGLLFLITIITLYNITNLLSHKKLAAFLSVLFFLSLPSNYKSLHYLGDRTMLSLPFLLLSAFFYFSAIRDNSYKKLFIALLFSLVDFTISSVGLFLTPISVSIFFFLYKREYAQSRKLFLTALCCSLFLALVTLILQATGFWGLKKLGHELLFNSYNPSIFHFVPGVKFYFREFYASGYFLLFSFLLILFLFERSKEAVFPIVWSFVSLLIFSLARTHSSKYFTEANIGICIFMAIVLVLSLSRKTKAPPILIVILYAVMSGSLAQAANNVRRVTHSFELARQSYSAQELNLKRLQSLPLNTEVYVDGKNSKRFYGLILSAMDRRDVIIKIAGDKTTVDKNLFFEGELTDDFKDKRGNWRF